MNKIRWYYLFWMAFRYLKSRKKEGYFSFATTISILGLAIGVAALTVTLAILTGFDREYKRTILGLSAHAVVLHSGDYWSVEKQAEVQKRLGQFPAVQAIQSFVLGEGMLTHRGKVKGVILKGISPDSPYPVTQLEPLLDPKMNLSQALKSSRYPSLVLGSSLARDLQVQINDIVQVIILENRRIPRLYPLKIRALFHSGMHEYDNRFGFLKLQEAQKIFSLDQNITGMEIAVTHPEKIVPIVRDLEKGIRPPNYIVHWKDLNANLFAALKLEKVVFFLVILPLVIVGALTVVAALIMFMMEKRKSIAILRTLGLGRKQIAWVFMIQGMFIGFTGTAIGLITGTLINLVLLHFPIITISPQVYFIDHLPIVFHFPDYLLIFITSLTICFFATVIPAIQASRLHPVEGLHEQ